MGVKIRQVNGIWTVFVNHHGRRKSKCVGTRKAAEEVKRQLEARLALGDLALFNDPAPLVPRFGEYADRWLKEHAQAECKKSTKKGYESVIEQYLRPRFGTKRLTEIRRDEVKAMINELIVKDLSRNTIRNALCVLRAMFNYAIEEELVTANPAAKLGRSTRAAKAPETTGAALTPTEAHAFLEAAKTVCPDYHPLFLIALRGGLRRGELVSLQWGDIQFGTDEQDENRFIHVQHNYVHREHTDTKSKKARRVDMSKDLRKALIELRDNRLLTAYLAGKDSISDDLVFPSPDGAILDPDNLYHRYFQPVLTKAGLRKIRLHDLRHTFGSLLIQAGASIVYVKEQMGHSSIQITVDIYGHLIPGANVSFVDKLDIVPEVKQCAVVQESASPAHMAQEAVSEESAQSIEEIGGGVWTRTTDLRIMRPIPPIDNKGD